MSEDGEWQLSMYVLYCVSEVENLKYLEGSSSFLENKREQSLLHAQHTQWSNATIMKSYYIQHNAIFLPE